MENGKSDTFPRKCQGLDRSQGQPRLPADRAPFVTPVWLCQWAAAGTHRDVGVLVEDDLEEVGREDGRGFEALLGPVHVHLLPIRSRWGAG